MDGLYGNIGGKIKGMAKVFFIVESIITILAGVALLISAIDSYNSEERFLLGFFFLALGPVIAWISSWLLYAFGELVEKTRANENNTRQILSVLQSSSDTAHQKNVFAETISQTASVKNSQESFSLKNMTQCECGKLFYGIYCPVCGKKVTVQSHQLF